MSAQRFNYFDSYQSLILECHRCHWKGTFEQGSVETYDDLMDCACPQCDVFRAPILAEVIYPTLEELRANAERPGIREWVQQIDNGFDEFEAQKLREPGQLPEIEADSFRLVWDVATDKSSGHSRTVLKHENAVIFSEPARYQEYKRFGEVAEILKAKYGERIKDLEPTKRSAEYLYGDPRVISGISVSPRCQRLGLYYQLYFDNIGQEEVCLFLRELLRHLRGQVIVVLDNSSTHQGKPLHQLLRQHSRLHIEHFPSYAPELNPDEGVWSLAKRALANSCPNDVEELVEDVIGSINAIRISTRKLRGCILQSGLPSFLR